MIRRPKACRRVQVSIGVSLRTHIAHMTIRFAGGERRRGGGEEGKKEGQKERSKRGLMLC